jgi:molecular chaperone DnaK
MLVHATRKTIEESGDKLTDEEKSQVEASVVELEQAIASEDTSVIEAATKGVNDVLTPLTQKLYTQEGEAQPDESSEEPADNTVDAEFEEVKEEDK